MSDENRNPLDVDAGLLRLAGDALLPSVGTLEIRPGLSLTRVVDGPVVVVVDGGFTEIQDTPDELAREIREAAETLRAQAEAEEEGPYLDPGQNPFIKTGERE